jgi:phosphoglycolate phosphatase
MPNYRGALLLDLDGTLVDTAIDFVRSIDILCQQLNTQPPSAAAIRSTVSDGSLALVKLCFNIDETNPDFERRRQQLLQIYAAELGTASELFIGFDSVLAQCEAENIAWGIITNKPLAFAAPLLQRLGIKPSRGVLVCPEHVRYSKPHAEPLLLAAQQLGLKPQQCLYAGDHIRDIEAGRNAQMPTIACAYGYIKADDDIRHWQADHYIQQPTDITAILNHYFSTGQ